MTMQQWTPPRWAWTTASGRGRRRSKPIPGKCRSIPPGRIEFRATLNYQLLVGPVAEFLKVPAETARPLRVVNTAATWVEIYD